MLRHDVRKGLAVGVGGGVAAGTILLAAGFKYYIGGVFFVTAVVLPSVRRLAQAEKRAATFEEIEGRFAPQAKISVTLAGLSGFYMTWKLDAWYRFAEADYWWMQAMVAVWAIFTVVLFIAEPLFLHDWFRTRAARDPEGTFAFVQRAHAVLLTASLVTIAGAMAGAHGWFVF